MAMSCTLYIPYLYSYLYSYGDATRYIVCEPFRLGRQHHRHRPGMKCPKHIYPTFVWRIIVYSVIVWRCHTLYMCEPFRLGRHDNTTGTALGMKCPKQIYPRGIALGNREVALGNTGHHPRLCEPYRLGRPPAPPPVISVPFYISPF